MIFFYQKLKIKIAFRELKHFFKRILIFIYFYWLSRMRVSFSIFFFFLLFKFCDWLYWKFSSNQSLSSLSRRTEIEVSPLVRTEWRWKVARSRRLRLHVSASRSLNFLSTWKKLIEFFYLKFSSIFILEFIEIWWTYLFIFFLFFFFINYCPFWIILIDSPSVYFRVLLFC